MNLFILDKNFEIIAPIDRLMSFIWVDRYQKAGDFEIKAAPIEYYTDHLVEGNYLWMTDSDRLMIVETIELNSNPESGDILTVKGRSIESVLDRRVIFEFSPISGNLQDGIELLMDQNALHPKNGNRQLPHIYLNRSTDYKITNLRYEGQFFGENLYDVIVSFAESYGFGWRIIPDSENLRRWKFEIYFGVDYSYSQNERFPVVFSESFENLSDSNYIYSRVEYKTVMMVGGEGEGADQKVLEVTREGDTGGFGLDRREGYVSARGSSNYDEDMTDEQKEEQYEKEMIQQGRDALAETDVVSAFDGIVDPNVQFKYGVDYNLGDVVQVVNRYGMESKSRIMEIVYSYDENGWRMVPTFESV